jgi:CDP-diacylglycerol--serine O-phosphatidyltransferase
MKQVDDDESSDSAFEADRPVAPRISRFKRVPMRVLLPNIITLLALCAGITAIRMGVDGRFELAVGLVIIAAIFDALDGRVARMLKGTSRFGAELDSLADFVNFGVTPALLIYFWSLSEMKNLGWIIALTLAICCALRLARFNVALEDPKTPAWKSGFFSGVNAPAAAMLAMAPMYLGFLGVIDGKAAAPVILPYIAIIAMLMVSRVPTFSGKNFGQRISREWVMPVLLLVVVFAALLASYPWVVLSVLTALYLCAIPFSYRSYNKQNKR